MVAPHWNQAVVGQPFGLTVPLSVALVAPMAVAGIVTTVGEINALPWYS